MRWVPAGVPPQRSFTMSADERIFNAFNTYVEENAKFVEKGNKAAGTRARNALLELAKAAKERRAEISAAKAESAK